MSYCVAYNTKACHCSFNFDCALNFIVTRWVAVRANLTICIASGFILTLDNLLDHYYKRVLIMYPDLQAKYSDGQEGSGSVVVDVGQRLSVSSDPS